MVVFFDVAQKSIMIKDQPVKIYDSHNALDKPGRYDFTHVFQILNNYRDYSFPFYFFVLAIVTLVSRDNCAEDL